MENYFIIKYIHIISSALLFGTGLGTAFFMLLAFLSKNVETLKYTTRHVVLADWIFTTPAVIIQPVTGIWLMLMLNYSFFSLWFYLTVSLYLLMGVCWIPVVFIQYKMKKIASIPVLTPFETKQLSSLMKWWVFLGIIAFVSILMIYWLMVSKVGLGKVLVFF
jgi:uncharacterized membrane protein